MNAEELRQASRLPLVTSPEHDVRYCRHHRSVARDFPGALPPAPTRLWDRPLLAVVCNFVLLSHWRRCCGIDSNPLVAFKWMPHDALLRQHR